MSFFIQMIQLQLTLFLLIFIGIALQRLGIITDMGKKCLSDITVNLILPCNIIVSFLGDINVSDTFFRNCVLAFLISLGIQLFSIFIGKYVFGMFPDKRRNIFIYGLIVSNSSFIGLPIVNSLYGHLGVLYTSIFQIPIRLTMWSSGLALFTRTDSRTSYKKLLCHPCIIAVFLGILCLIFSPQFPAFLENTLTGISGCMVPVSMITIGSMLSQSRLSQFCNPSILYYCLIRLLLYPLILLGILRLFQVDGLLTSTIVLLSAMPMANATAILADKYDCDSAFASQTIFVSTFLSILTLPVFSLILQ